MIKVESEIEVYEVDGIDTKPGNDGEKVYVMSHWNRRELIVLKYKEKKLTILACDLINAINNATNR